MTISGKRKTNHKTQETSIMSQSVVDAYSMDILSEREVYGSYHLLQPRKSRFFITVMLQILDLNGEKYYFSKHSAREGSCSIRVN